MRLLLGPEWCFACRHFQNHPDNAMSVQIDTKDDDGRTDREPNKRLEWFQTLNYIGYAKFRFHFGSPVDDQFDDSRFSPETEQSLGHVQDR